MILATAVVVLCGCNRQGKYYDNRLKVKNNYGKTIVAYYSYSYPDTMITAADMHANIEANNWKATTGASITLGRGGTWETAFAEQIPSGRIMVYVLDLTVYNTVPWSTISSSNMLLKRFDMTLQQLKDQNFELTVD